MADRIEPQVRLADTATAGTAQGAGGRRLTVLVPRGLTPHSFLLDAPRFREFNLQSFEDVRAYTAECFDVDFQILYLGKDPARDLDLVGNEYIAFLTAEDVALGGALTYCCSAGIPVVFIRHDPEMRCEAVDFTNRSCECCEFRPFQTRFKCASRNGHCEGRYFEALDFDNAEGTLQHAKDHYKTAKIPIFQISFLIDFIIWYGKFGSPLVGRRDRYIQRSAKDGANRKIGQAALNAAINEMVQNALESGGANPDSGRSEW